MTDSDSLTKLAALVAQQINPLSSLESLQKAVDNKWVITTEQVRLLIGTKPVCPQERTTYQRGSFIFTKWGKVGTQWGWLVTKA